MKLNHVLSSDQFMDVKILEELLNLAKQMEEADQAKRLKKSLAEKIVACMFYEPSTRTRLSFETAVLKLGGQVIGAENASQSSSFVKGETLEDTIKMLCNYAQAIVLRHPQDGAAQEAAAVSSVPIINAGDGGNQHPTQALLDLYTILKEKGRLQNLKIVMVGDLLNGRTVHSLLPLLTLYPNNKFYFVSPAQLNMPDKYKQMLKEKGLTFVETDNLNQAMGEADIFYMTRVQKERFNSMQEYESLKHAFVLTKEMLPKLPTEAVIMHALPRVGEIAREVDSDKRAAYFRQAKNGLYLRMALLHKILGG